MTERDLTAEMRGLCIHWIRAYRSASHGTFDRHERKVHRAMARARCADLRELGPGEVQQPTIAGGGVLGERVEWIGCDSCDGSGTREKNIDGADVPVFCMFCPRGVAGKRRQMRRDGFGWLIPKTKGRAA